MKGPGIGRREFMQAGTGILSAGFVLGGAAEKAAGEQGGAEEYSVKWYPFTGWPDSDTCWSLSVGPDGRIYAAACNEGMPGGIVKPVRYNEQRDDLDYLFDLAEKVE